MLFDFTDMYDSSEFPVRNMLFSLKAKNVFCDFTATLTFDLSLQKSNQLALDQRTVFAKFEEIPSRCSKAFTDDPKTGVFVYILERYICVTKSSQI